MTERIIDFISALGFNAILSFLEKQHDKGKIKADIKAFVRREYESQCKDTDVFQELDLNGLLNYLKNNLITDIQSLLFSLEKDSSDKQKNLIIAKAITYAGADTEEKKNFITKLIYISIDITRNYYADKLDGKYKLLANITRDSILNAVLPKLDSMDSKLDGIPFKTAALLRGTYPSDIKYVTAAPPCVTKNFIHREKLVQDIIELVKDGKKVLISAMGGIGKTSVARSVFHKLKDEYECAAWIEYQTDLQTSVLSSFTLFQDQKKGRYTSILQFLRNTGKRTILFIDNLSCGNTQDTALKDFCGLPMPIVITSRLTGLTYFETVQTDFLTDEQAADLFYAYYAFDTERKNKELVKKLIGLAKNHTLTVELLAKTARLPGTNLQTFYDTIREKGFGYPELEIETEHTDRMQTIANHLRTLYDMVSVNDEQKRILRIFAVLPSITLPQEIRQWINCSVKDLQYLVQIGWINGTETGYEMHPVVKETIRLKGITQETCEVLFSKIAEGTFFADTEGYIIADIKLRCADAVCNFFPYDETESLAAAFNNIASVYHAQGNYELALEYHKKALDIRETRLGKEHPDTAISYNNIALVHQNQGNYDLALVYHKKDIDICEAKFGKEHPDTAASYSNIALVYQNQGNYDLALVYHKQAIDICEAKLGKEHPYTAISYNNIALVHQNQGNYDFALEYFKKALDIREAKLGKEHPSTATSYNNIASVYNTLGNYDLALKYHKKALDIYEAVLGKEHPSTATSYNNIALAYKAQGNYELALDYHKKALDIREAKFGKEHPSTAASYNNIALVYQDLGNYEIALEYFKKALHIREAKLGKEHPYTAASYSNIASVYNALGNYDLALKYHKKALDICEAKLGKEHPDTKRVQGNITRILEKMNSV